MMMVCAKYADDNETTSNDANPKSIVIVAETGTLNLYVINSHFPLGFRERYHYPPKQLAAYRPLFNSSYGYY